MHTTEFQEEVILCCYELIFKVLAAPIKKLPMKQTIQGSWANKEVGSHGSHESIVDFKGMCVKESGWGWFKAAVGFKESEAILWTLRL